MEEAEQVEQIVELTPKARIMEGLADFLEMLRLGLDQGGQFAAEQIPEVLQELIILARVESGIYLVVGLVLPMFAIKYGRKLFSKGQQVRKDEPSAYSSSADGYQAAQIGPNSTPILLYGSKLERKRKNISIPVSE